jgi:hypothetical protein
VQNGTSILTIAAVMISTRETKNQAERHPSIANAKPATRIVVPLTQPRPRPYDAEVVRLREEDLLPFEEIVRRLGITKTRASRAYDRLRPEAVRQSAKTGKRPRSRFARCVAGVNLLFSPTHHAEKIR